MSNKLAYLHIPKSAGTSQRAMFYQLYGNESVFWHGIDSDAVAPDPANEVTDQDAAVIGGHRPISHYPENTDYLYLAVVREPISRIVSLYSYYTKPQFAEENYVAAREDVFREWQKRGMDSESLLNSLDKCPEFRYEIENYQCRYLSRYQNTLEGVQRTLADTHCIVCDVESIGSMNALLSGLLEWGPVAQRRTNRSLENTHQLLMQEPGLEQVLTDLAEEDMKLYRFIRENYHGLYTHLPLDPDFYARLKPETPLHRSGQDPLLWNRVQLYTKGYIGINKSGAGSTGVAVVNKSAADISQNKFPSCRICYTVHDHLGNKVDPENYGQPFRGAVKAGDTLMVDLQVQIPDTARARASMIKIWLSVSATESVTDHNPMHQASAHIFPV